MQDESADINYTSCFITKRCGNAVNAH